MLKGLSVPAGKGNVTVFPFKDASTAEKRTKEDYKEHTEEAVDSNNITHIYGIIGLSWLATLGHYDIIERTGIDYMHCVLLGVVKHS